MRDWNTALDRGVDLALIRSDMERGSLRHRHLSDEELVSGIRQMRQVAAKLPRDPGAASAQLLAAMRQ